MLKNVRVLLVGDDADSNTHRAFVIDDPFFASAAAGYLVTKPPSTCIETNSVGGNVIEVSPDQVRDMVGDLVQPTPVMGVGMPEHPLVAAAHVTAMDSESFVDNASKIGDAMVAQHLQASQPEAAPNMASAAEAKSGS